MGNINGINDQPLIDHLKKKNHDNENKGNNDKMKALQSHVMTRQMTKTAENIHGQETNSDARDMNTRGFQSGGNTDEKLFEQIKCSSFISAQQTDSDLEATKLDAFDVSDRSTLFRVLSLTTYSHI